MTTLYFSLRLPFFAAVYLRANTRDARPENRPKETRKKGASIRRIPKERRIGQTHFRPMRLFCLVAAFARKKKRTNQQITPLLLR